MSNKPLRFWPPAGFPVTEVHCRTCRVSFDVYARGGGGPTVAACITCGQRIQVEVREAPYRDPFRELPQPAMIRNGGSA